jgi:hypothetical protein
MLPRIMEWLILLLLVPAIVVPVVLFFGFAGCSFDLPPGPSLFINSIEPTALKTLTVEWTDTDPGGVGFEIHRTKVSDKTSTVRTVEDPSLRSIIDDGLEPATQYSYTVRRILKDSPESEAVTGTTLGPALLFPPQLLAQEIGREGFTIVQRIEPVKLKAGGNRVAISLIGGSPRCEITGIYISQAAPEPGADPYDAFTDLAPVVSDFVALPPGHVLTLPVIHYRLDPTKPLLVAFEFNDLPEAGTVRRSSFIPPLPEGVTAYVTHGGDEADKQDRHPGYQPLQALYLIESIDVAEVPG